ncbi:MAG: sigma-70 family RNA polymerase sigma factor [Planctomycetota bacterium]
MGEQADSQVSRILQAAEAGDPHAARELLPLVYDELRKLAHAHMANESSPTLQTTALVHEAYLRLVGSTDPGWANRGHFFGAAARAMRRILVDRARRRHAIKRGGGRVHVPLSKVDVSAVEQSPAEVLGLNEALDRLERIDSRKVEIVMLRYFAGLTVKETAAALSLSATTVKDEWQFARAWLLNEMSCDP